MRVLVTFWGDWPGNTAMSHRMSLMARGIKAAGADTRMLVRRRAGLATPDWDSSDVGIPVMRMGSMPRETVVDRLLYIPRSVAHMLGCFRQAVETFRPDIVILYPQSWYLFIRSFWVVSGVLDLCHRRNIRCVLELNELHPASIKAISNGLYADQWLVLQGLLRRADAVLAISRLWSERARRRGLPTIRVPILCDPSEHGDKPLKTPPKHGPFRLTYLGYLAPRDLPHEMLEGVRSAAQRGLDIQLQIIGNTERLRSGRDLTRAIRSDPVLSERVRPVGWVSDEELFGLLQTSHALVLLRPDSSESSACFPTRLGHYLQSGRPVILSDVADFPVYFKDRRNALLLPSDDVSGSLAVAMEFLREHPDRADEIGSCGRSTASEVFSYLRHGRRLLEFFEGLTRCPKRSGR